MSRSKACEQAHCLARALEQTLRTLGVLPARAIDSLAQMQAVFADVPVLLLGGPTAPTTARRPSWTARPTTRVKKRRTRKNTLIADPSRYIHYRGPSTSRSTHDFQLLRNEFGANPGLLDLFALLTDLGYLGLVKHDDVPAGCRPHRKPRRSKKCPVAALADIQRVDNCVHARRRVKVEHAISGARRLGCVAQTFRNKSNAFNDRVMAIACGIWNWHLMQNLNPV